MKRTTAIIVILFATLATLAAQQPNIIFMVADDLGYGDLSSYNPNAEGAAPNNTPIRTPHLDQMAERGARFTDVHSAAPICSPSRRAILTARYPSRLGEWAEAYRSKPEGLVAAEDPTIGMWLKQAGYATAAYGKWNVGETAGVSWPTAHGFDDWLIIDHNTGYFQHKNANAECQGRPMLFETGGERVTNLEGQYLTNIWTDKALDFIDANEDQPFFLYLPWSIPHTPLQDPDGDPSMAFDAQPSRTTAEGRAVYVKMVEHLDTQIGRIFTALEARGLTENTLIIFTSDNGGMQTANCWPLKKSKQWLEEGGIRVPFIMQWPRYVHAGHVNDRPAILMDASVSILAAGQALQYVPAGRQLDGVNFFDGSEPDGSREFGWRRRDWDERARNAANFLRQEAYRAGDWKLLRTYQYMGNKAWSAEYKDELYNLSDDIGETTNLIKAMPEKYAAMKAAFGQWKAEVVEQNPNYVIPVRDQLGSPANLPEAPSGADAIALNFDGKRFEGRVHRAETKHLVSKPVQEGGVFKITVQAGATPPLVYVDGAVDTAKYSRIRYEMKLTTDSTIGRARAVLRQAAWKGDDLLFTPVADGQWHEYVVDCTQSSAWSQWTPEGRIGIALPVPANGALEVELKTIRLLK
ncbi:sulfatase-like hydrolase/transferase [Opitutales bacterium]|nr:sulfatase-like hydrolase/transferase [Opitutales bacterium]MDB2682289.1 sulfatase-like hydrolase/transferase [Opitutales bacterium]